MSSHRLDVPPAATPTAVLPPPSDGAKTGTPRASGGSKVLRFAVPLLVGAVIWFLPIPEGVEPAAWHLLAIFVATIAGIIAKPLPMGAVAIMGIAVTALTQTLTIQESLSGFSNATIWLIVLAFFIARGFIKTGLGARIAYMFVARIGGRTLGLSYGLAATDLVLAPAIPSNTARAGGVVYPIARSLASGYNSEPEDGTARRVGSFLILTAFQVNVVTSAMFVTAMAANPLAVELARSAGVEISWTQWALAASVPGLISLLVVPLVVYKLYPPELKETPEAPIEARRQLAAMGPMSRAEKTMLGTFALLLALWTLGDQLFDLSSTVAALIGLGVLLIGEVLTWDDILNERSAWDTLVWFAALVMMATFLNELGLVPWFSEKMSSAVDGMGWQSAFILLTLVYFASHYLFASNTAHVSAMFAAFLATSVAIGAPPLLAALVLGFISSLYGGLTHYGTGPAPVLFGSGYVPLGAWWRFGALMAAINIVIWMGVGSVWMNVIGVW